MEDNVGAGVPHEEVGLFIVELGVHTYLMVNAGGVDWVYFYI